jgi:hypothetical protein
MNLRSETQDSDHYRLVKAVLLVVETVPFQQQEVRHW